MQVSVSTTAVELTSPNTTPGTAIKLSATDLDFHYGTFQALHGISMKIFAHHVTALIGPSGCGKSTFLRTLNRLNETVRNTRVDGTVLLDGQNIAHCNPHVKRLCHVQNRNRGIQYELL